MSFALVLAALAPPSGPVTISPMLSTFDLAKVRPKEGTCVERTATDDILVCAPKGMDFLLGDVSGFASKPLRFEFGGPLGAETTIHVIQHTSPLATSPAAALTLKWHF